MSPNKEFLAFICGSCRQYLAGFLDFANQSGKKIKVKINAHPEAQSAVDFLNLLKK